MQDRSRAADPSTGIYVLSGPVQTGKTTRLRSWCDKRLAHSRQLGMPADVDGILAPVVDGRRHLLHIGTGTIHDLEDLSGQAPAVTIRRFTFNATVFAWARGCLAAAVEPSPEWIIVDEIGPLELSGGGLEPAVTELLARAGYGPHPSQAATTSIVLVIREHLVGEALAHFGVSRSVVHDFAMTQL